MGFTAPEIIEGKQYDYACDVYSLGSLLYMLCTYECPSLLEAVKPIPEEYSGFINSIVLALLSKKP